MVGGTRRREITQALRCASDRPLETARRPSTPLPYAPNFPIFPSPAGPKNRFPYQQQRVMADLAEEVTDVENSAATLVTFDSPPPFSPAPSE